MNELRNDMSGRPAPMLLGLLPSPDEASRRLLGRLAAVVAVALVGFAGFSAYELIVLDFQPLG